jgi:hypothetical protein
MPQLVRRRDHRHQPVGSEQRCPNSAVGDRHQQALSVSISFRCIPITDHWNSVAVMLTKITVPGSKVTCEPGL